MKDRTENTVDERSTRGFEKPRFQGKGTKRGGELTSYKMSSRYSGEKKRHRRDD